MNRPARMSDAGGASGRLFSDFSKVDTAGTAEEVLREFPLKGGTVFQDGACLRLSVSWSTAANVNSKTFRVRLTDAAGPLLMSFTTTANGAEVAFSVLIVRKSSTTAMVVASGGANGASLQTLRADPVALDWAVDNVIAVCGLSPTTAGDVTYRQVLVERI